MPNIQLVNLSCGGCFASVEETNHGGANDSFKLNYNGNVSAPITNGVNFSAAGIGTALAPLLPAGATATVAGFGGGVFNSTGFQVTYSGSLAATNVPVTLTLQNLSAGVSAFTGETDKGGAVDNQGGVITPTGNAIPVPSVPASFTIPLRTPFSLTGSATDADAGDTLTYSWEQNDRGAANGISLLTNTKTSGPLFSMFPISGQISDSYAHRSPADTIEYDHYRLCLDRTPPQFMRESLALRYLLAVLRMPRRRRAAPPRIRSHRKSLAGAELLRPFRSLRLAPLWHVRCYPYVSLEGNNSIELGGAICEETVRS